MQWQQFQLSYGIKAPKQIGKSKTSVPGCDGVTVTQLLEKPQLFQQSINKLNTTNFRYF